MEMRGWGKDEGRIGLRLRRSAESVLVKLAMKKPENSKAEKVWVRPESPEFWPMRMS